MIGADEASDVRERNPVGRVDDNVVAFVDHRFEAWWIFASDAPQAFEMSLNRSREQAFSRSLSEIANAAGRRIW
jgi:hypothetical protein